MRIRRADHKALELTRLEQRRPLYEAASRILVEDAAGIFVYIPSGTGRSRQMCMMCDSADRGFARYPLDEHELTPGRHAGGCQHDGSITARNGTPSCGRRPGDVIPVPAARNGLGARASRAEAASAGRFVGLGGSPSSQKVSVTRAPPTIGTRPAAIAYTGASARKTPRQSHRSLHTPRYITAMRCEISRTTARSWLMTGRSDQIARGASRNNRSTVACTETSSPDVGSSRITRLGRSIRMRARPIRRCCPPLSSCGYRSR